MAEHSDDWPLRRADEVSDTVWSRQLNDAIRIVDAAYSLPIVVAGVKRSVQRIFDLTGFDVIDHVPGNHDRTGSAELHTLVRPLVLDWRDQQQSRALGRLDDARSARRYASGAHEIWPLANDGRVDLVVVEGDFSFSARVDPNGQLDHLHAEHDPDHRGVTDDVVDEIIEAVLQQGGDAVMVDTAVLAGHGRIAAVLRY